MDAAVEEAILHMAQLGAGAPAWRSSQVEIMSSAAAALSTGEDSVDARLKSAACPGPNVTKVAGSVNVALICAMSDAIGWPDVGLSEGMMKGF